MIRQQSGEDWRNVDLTLSTARPAIGGAPPELTPWNVSFYRPQPMVSERAYPAAAPTLKKSDRGQINAATTAVETDESVAEFATARISDEQSSVSFHVPQPLDIPSDGNRHGSIVAVEQLPVSIEYLAVPKLSPAVFLKSEIVNRAPYPLLPGKVNIFIGTSFTGSSQLKKVAAGEKFELFFGNDDQVSVKREELKQH